MRARLILEDKSEFEGETFGYEKSIMGEIVVNTLMSGYTEALTDPSNYKRFLCMSYPLVGNYGISFDDEQSQLSQVSGIIVREKCDLPNNPSCEMDISTYLKMKKITGIEGIDTRSLIKKIKDKPYMKAMVVVHDDVTYYDVKEKFTSFGVSDYKDILSREIRHFPNFSDGAKKIAMLDFGIKKSEIEAFKKRGADITIYPYNTEAKEILDGDFDLVYLSDGPLNPLTEDEILENVRGLLGKLPLSGTGFSFYLLSRILGGQVEEDGKTLIQGDMPFKEKGSDHIIQAFTNSAYYLEDVPDEIKVSHINLRTNKISGIRDEENKVLAFAFNPQGSPGSNDGEGLFDEILEMI